MGMSDYKDSYERDRISKNDEERFTNDIEFFKLVNFISKKK